MNAHELPLENDTSEEPATGTLPKPDPENRMSIKFNKPSKDVAPDTMRPAGNGSDSSDFDPAVSASSFATGAPTRSSWAGLCRHPPSRVFGPRDPIASGRLLSAMRLQAAANEQARVAQVLEGTLLDGQLLWDAYLIALHIGMPLSLQELDGGDLIAHRCIHGLHARRLSQSRHALVVVSVCDWADRGRPKGTKSTHSVDFSRGSTGRRTTEELSELAGFGTTLISQAKVL